MDEPPRITGVNDWERLVLKYHRYYAGRQRRRILLGIGWVLTLLLLWRLVRRGR
jgi:hypothetical protein